MSPRTNSVVINTAIKMAINHSLSLILFAINFPNRAANPVLQLRKARIKIRVT